MQQNSKRKENGSKRQTHNCMSSSDHFQKKFALQLDVMRLRKKPLCISQHPTGSANKAKLFCCALYRKPRTVGRETEPADDFRVPFSPPHDRFNLRWAPLLPLCLSVPWLSASDGFPSRSLALCLVDFHRRSLGRSFQRANQTPTLKNNLLTLPIASLHLFSQMNSNGVGSFGRC